MLFGVDRSARTAGAPAGGVTSRVQSVVPAPLAAYSHDDRSGGTRDHGGFNLAKCSCGWQGNWSHSIEDARVDWLEHAVAAYQAEEVQP